MNLGLGIGLTNPSLLGGAAWPFPSILPDVWINPQDRSSLSTATSGGTKPAYGVSVALARDKSGNDRNATQSTASARPVLRGKAILGRDALEFNINTDIMAFPSVTGKTFVTIMMAGSFGRVDGDQGELVSINGSGGFMVGVNNSRSRTGRSLVAWDATANSPTFTRDQMVVLTATASASGQSIATGSGTAATTGTVPTFNGILEIGYQGALNNVAPWNMVELAIFYRALTTEEKTTIRNYLARTKTAETVTSYLKSTTDRVIRTAKTTFTAGSLAGQLMMRPGTSYPQEFLRDSAMAMRSRPEMFTASEMADRVTWFLAKRIDGIMPEGIQVSDSQGIVAGGAIMTTLNKGLAAADSPYELVDIIYSHYLKTGSPSLYVATKSDTDAVLASVTITNHLVFIADNVTPSAIQPGFGFQDSIASSGYELMCSVLRYRAHSQLAALAIAAGDSASATTYAAALPLIQTSLDTYLWDNSTGLYKNASIRNQQHAIAGNLYAVVTGAAGSRAATIMALLAADYTGAPFTLNGAVRHLRAGVYWSDFRFFPGYADYYQNGPFWATFTGWLEKAFRLTGYTSLAEDVRTKIKTFQTGTSDANFPIEAYHPASSYLSGAPYNGSVNYVASICMPLVGNNSELR
jgi:hypothetical protein